MAKELTETYPDLAHLLGAYLHQDFAIYGGTLADAVTAFAEDDAPKAASGARSDIARLLQDHAPDLERALRLLEPGHARPPGMDARSYLHWLDGLLAGAAHAHHDAAE